MSQLAVTSSSNQPVLINYWTELPSEIILQIYLQVISQGGSLKDVNSLLRTNRRLNLIGSKEAPIVWETLLEKYFSGSYKTNPEIPLMDQFKDLCLIEKAVRSGLCERTELEGNWWARTTCLMEHDGKIFTANEYGLKIVRNKKFESHFGLFESPEFIEAMALHKSSLFLIMAENGETWLDASIICVYGPSGTLTKHLKGHLAKVTCLCTIGNRLYSGSFDSTIKVWDMDSLELLKTYGQPRTDGGGITALFPYKGELYSGDVDGTIKKWNLENGEFIVEQDETKDDINSLFVDEDRLISTSDGIIYVKDRKNKTMVHKKNYYRANYGANCVEKFGDLLFVDTMDNATVSIWDLKTGTMLFEHKFKKPPEIIEINVATSSLRFRQGKLFMSSGSDVVIFDFAAQLDYEKKIKEAKEDSQMLPPPAKKIKLSKEAKEDFQVESPPIMVPFSREVSDSLEFSDKENE